MSFFNQTRKTINLSSYNIGDPSNVNQISIFSKNITFDLVLFREYVNTVMYPIINTLTSKPRYPKDVLESGLSGETIITWLESQGNTSSSSPLFWDSLSLRPKTIKESFDYISTLTRNNIVQNITNVNADIEGIRNELLNLINEVSNSQECNVNNSNRLALDMFGASYILNCESSGTLETSVYDQISNLKISLGLNSDGSKSDYSHTNYIQNTDSHHDAIGKIDSELKNLNDNKISTLLIGASNGIAPLNASSKIDSEYLPSYVDDILEYDDLTAFPEVGEAGKIYIAKDTNNVYRWATTVYVEVSPGSPNSLIGLSVTNPITKSGDSTSPTIGINASSSSIANYVVQRSATGSINVSTVNGTSFVASNVVMNDIGLSTSNGDVLYFQSNGGPVSVGGQTTHFAPLNMTGGSSDINFTNAPSAINFSRYSHATNIYQPINFNVDATTADKSVKVLNVVRPGAGNSYIKWNEDVDQWQFYPELPNQIPSGATTNQVLAWDDSNTLQWKSLGGISNFFFNTRMDRFNYATINGVSETGTKSMHSEDKVGFEVLGHTVKMFYYTDVNNNEVAWDHINDSIVTNISLYENSILAVYTPPYFAVYTNTTNKEIYINRIILNTESQSHTSIQFVPVKFSVSTNILYGRGNLSGRYLYNTGDYKVNSRFNVSSVIEVENNTEFINGQGEFNSLFNTISLSPGESIALVMLELSGKSAIQAYEKPYVKGLNISYHGFTESSIGLS